MAFDKSWPAKVECISFGFDGGSFLSIPPYRECIKAAHSYSEGRIKFQDVSPEMRSLV